MAANEAQQRAWNNAGMIERWKGIEPSAGPALEPLLAATQLKPGERVLDIGCGGGLTTLAAARAVGPSGLALGADLSAPMLEVARGRATEAGLGNVTFAVVDAQTADFAGAPFDSAMSRFGVMFFSDPVAAFANIARHLRSGGRLAFACWQDAKANTWQPSEISARYNPAPPRVEGRPGPSPFAFADAAYVSGILASAGFANIAHANQEYEWSDPVGGPMFDPGQLSSSLDAETLARATAELKAYEKSIAVDGMVTQQRRYRIFTASKP